MYSNNDCSCVWLILIVILLLFACGGCGSGCGNSCGNSCNCGCGGSSDSCCC